MNIFALGLVLFGLSTQNSSADIFLKEGSNLPRLVIENSSKHENRKHGYSLTVSCVELACENIKFDFVNYEGQGPVSKIVSVKDLLAKVNTHSEPYAIEWFGLTRFFTESMKSSLDEGRYVKYAAFIPLVGVFSVIDTASIFFMAPSVGLNVAKNGIKNSQAHHDRMKILKKFLDSTVDGTAKISVKDRQFKKYRRFFRAVYFK